MTSCPCSATVTCWEWTTSRRTVPLDAAPDAYETFQKKQDGAIKILLSP